MSFVLVLYIYAGAFAKGDSVTLQAIAGFRSEAECQTAGRLSEPLVKDSAKNFRFVCLKQESAK